MSKIERKYLVHFVDSNFDPTGANAEYYKLGEDLEEYSVELNPDVEVKRNIWGEQTVQHNGYEISSEVDPFYAQEGDPLFEHLAEIANERLIGDPCITTAVDALIKADGTCVWAYREKVWVVPNSMGGDTSGVQIPFTLHAAGSRVKGTFDIDTLTFTPLDEGADDEG